MEQIEEWLHHHFDGNAPVAQFLGLDAATAQLEAHQSGISDVRVVVLDDGVEGHRVFHSDHRSGRLNLAIVGGTVVRAAFF